jgi:hypothetical protein
MKLKFLGDYKKLEKYASRTGTKGKWRELENGKKQYRTNDGAVLNWWPSGTILFQGQDPGMPFEQAFISIASAKGRLEHTKQPNDVQEEDATLR